MLEDDDYLLLPSPESKRDQTKTAELEAQITHLKKALLTESIRVNCYVLITHAFMVKQNELEAAFIELSNKFVKQTRIIEDAFIAFENINASLDDIIVRINILEKLIAANAVKMKINDKQTATNRHRLQSVNPYNKTKKQHDPAMIHRHYFTPGNTKR